MMTITHEEAQEIIRANLARLDHNIGLPGPPPETMPMNIAFVRVSRKLKENRK